MKWHLERNNNGICISIQRTPRLLKMEVIRIKWGILTQLNWWVACPIKKARRRIWWSKHFLIVLQWRILAAHTMLEMSILSWTTDSQLIVHKLVTITKLIAIHLKHSIITSWIRSSIAIPYLKLLLLSLDRNKLMVKIKRIKVARLFIVIFLYLQWPLKRIRKQKLIRV